MAWIRGRRTVSMVVGGLVALALLLALGAPRWQAHRDEERPQWFGQNFALRSSGLSPATSFVVGDSVVVAGGTIIGQNSFTLVTEDTRQQRGLFSASGPQGIDDTGSVWAVQDAPVPHLVHHRAEFVSRGQPFGPVVAWGETGSSVSSRGGLELLAADQNVAIVQNGCTGDAVCEVVGVRADLDGRGDDRVAWRHDASQRVGLVYSVGGPLTLRAPSYSVALAQVGVFVLDDRLILVDADGERRTTEVATDPDGRVPASSLALVGDRLLTITQDGDTCTVTADTMQGREWTSEPAQCSGTEPVLTEKTLYLSHDANSTGTRSETVVAISLADGSVTRLDDLVGLAGFGDDIVVDGEGGKYRAQSAVTGETLWTTELEGADPQDSPGLGTGRASVGGEVVAVVHEPSGWARRLSGSNGQRVSLLDRESGEVLTTAAAPDGHTFQDVVALQDRRALLYGSDGRITLLAP